MHAAEGFDFGVEFVAAACFCFLGGRFCLSSAENSQTCHPEGSVFFLRGEKSKRGLVLYVFLRPNTLIRHITRTPLHPVIHTKRASRTQRLVVIRRHAQSRAQFLVEPPQVTELFHLHRKFLALMPNQKFLIS